MVAQVVFSEYVPSWFSSGADDVKTDTLNKLGADVSTSEMTVVEYYDDQMSEQNTNTNSAIVAVVEEGNEEVKLGETQSELNFEDNSSTTNSLPDFEDINVTTSQINPYLREDQLRAAGFVTAFFEEEKNDDMLYKTVYVGDMKNVIKKKYIIRDDALLYAKVYIFSPDTGIDVSAIYLLLKEKCESSSNVSINETNQFGKASYYMNDTLREETAFLTVKLNSIVYAFSYPKAYHKQVSNLIKLIGLEK
jgi:hypothetical protein